MENKSKDEVLRDAREAKRLLDDADLKRFLDELERDIFASFLQVEAGDVSELTKIHGQQSGIEAIRRKLRSLVDDGIVENHSAK